MRVVLFAGLGAAILCAGCPSGRSSGEDDVGTADEDSGPEYVDTTGSADVGAADTGPAVDSSDATTESAPPTVVIDSPEDGHVYTGAVVAVFSGTVSDDLDAPEKLAIRWAAGDLMLSETPADGTGHTTVQTDALGVGAHTVQLTATDSHGNTASAQVQIVVNGPPSAAVVSILPASPKTTDALEATLTSEAVDPNGDEVTYDYVWSRNGLVTGLDGATVPAAQTAKGQLWQVEVTGRDSYAAGPAATAEALVLNSPPVCSVAAIEPAAPNTAAPLSCACTEWADDDPFDEPGVETCEWTVDGETFVGCTLPAGTAAAGQTVGCTVTPTDGEEPGVPAVAESVVLGNSPPHVQGTLSVEPSGGGGPCDTWSCVLSGDVVDPDGAGTLALVFSWTIDGVDAGVDDPTLEGLALKEGSSLQCALVASDGELESEPVVSTPAVVGSPGLIALLGPEASSEGAAGWNTFAGAPEPEKTGHPLPASIPCVNNYFAYYYTASRDYGGIDPSSPGAFHAAGQLAGFPNLEAALAAGGFDAEQLRMKFGVLTLGDDIQGQDWVFVDGVETRYYSGGTFSLELNGQPLVSGPMPDTTMVIEYKVGCDFTDDKITIETEYASPAVVTDDPTLAPVAQALLEDAGGELRFVFNARLPAIEISFQANGRIGGYFEVIGGGIEPAACVSP